MLKKMQKHTQTTAVLELSDSDLPSLISTSPSSSEQDLDIIHALPNPPLVTLKSDEIFIRQCKLAGDAVDAHGGRFHTEDLPHLLKLSQGAPALIGHNRQAPAVARFFGGEIVKIGENSFIAPKFYWPRAHSTASDLRLQIDTGIIHEASLAFTFEKATCNICGQDIRTCQHMIFDTYEDKLCFYWYENVHRVLEGSFVYQGAEPGTGFLDMQSQNIPSHVTIDGKLFAVLQVT